jgi:hypothetical protein
MFDDFLARSFSDLTYGRFHRILVDLYSLQHPDKYCRSAKSFAAHLTGLCCVMEHDGDVRVNSAIQKWLSGKVDLEKPVMPKRRGDVNTSHFVELDDVDVAAMFDEWRREVWNAYSDHHALARPSTLPGPSTPQAARRPAPG